MENKYVTVGENASIFHDQTTGITVCKKEIVQLTPKQVLSKRIRMALSSGHLVYTSPELEKSKEEVGNDELIERLTAKYKTLVDAGKSHVMIANAFNADELRLIAEGFHLDVEDGDTKADISEAIFDEVSQ